MSLASPANKHWGKDGASKSDIDLSGKFVLFQIAKEDDTHSLIVLVFFDTVRFDGR